MKTIAVYAYTQFNLGDDLFIKVLCERYPKTKFIILAPKEYKNVFKEINNLRIIPSDSKILRGLNFIFRKIGVEYFTNKVLAFFSRASILIGGSLFMQNEHWEKNLVHVKSMRAKNKPFFLLGANFGPFYGKNFYNQHRKIFSEFTDICFRDRYSYNLFKELNNVRQADDIVFQLKYSCKYEKQGNNIVISVIKPSVRSHLKNYDNIYYNKIKDIILFFVNKNYNVILMSFCEYEEDDKAIDSIFELLPDKCRNSVSKYYYKTNLERALSIIAKSNFVVATRFHSMILGWLFNKPVLPIIYSEKMTNVIKDIGFSGLYVDLKNINKLESKDVFECMGSNFVDISKQIINSDNQFKKLDSFLLR